MRWIGPVFLAAVFLASWLATFFGGRFGIGGWILITVVWPLVGLVMLFWFALVSAIRRRVTRTRGFTALLALPMIWPLAWAFDLGAVAYPASEALTRPSIAVRPPSDSPLRVVWGGSGLAHNRHASSPGQRWAYDLVVEPAATGARSLADYGCFGTPVLAPMGGVVALASDGAPDLAIGETLADPAGLLGNHVVLKLETGTHLVIAHLKKGSVRVRTGDVVAESQVLGACGNSGNSSEPHIHLHHQRQNPNILRGDLDFGVNYVEGLPLTFRSLKGPERPRGGIEVRNNQVRLTGDKIRYDGTR